MEGSSGQHHLYKLSDTQFEVVGHKGSNYAEENYNLKNLAKQFVNRFYFNYLSS